MNATKTLPLYYVERWTLDLRKNHNLAWILNLIGLGLFILFGWLFLGVLNLIRPGFALAGELNLGWLLATVFTYCLTLFLHEMVHVIFYWSIIRERPPVGFRGLYAYTAAPDWYVPRNAFLLTALAPLIVITLLGIILMFIVPDSILILVLLAMTTNAAGAIGDMYIVARTLKYPTAALIQDCGDSVTIYCDAAQTTLSGA